MYFFKIQGPGCNVSLPLLIFIENEQEVAITLSCHVVRVFVHKIGEEDIGNVLVQQDDDTCHTVEATLFKKRKLIGKEINK